MFSLLRAAELAIHSQQGGPAWDIALHAAAADQSVRLASGMAWGAEIAEMVATTAAQRMALKPTSSRQCSQLQRAQQPVLARKLSQSDLLSAIAGGVCDKPQRHCLVMVSGAPRPSLVPPWSFVFA